MEKIKGFRAPFLVHSAAQRGILQKNGFTYDSSVPEIFPTATSPDEHNRLWPYTMDHGLPQRCRTGTGGRRPHAVRPGCPWQPRCSGSDSAAIPVPTSLASLAGLCNTNESHPGLWEIPMWAYQVRVLLRQLPAVPPCMPPPPCQVRRLPHKPSPPPLLAAEPIRRAQLGDGPARRYLRGPQARVRPQLQRCVPLLPFLVMCWQPGRFKSLPTKSAVSPPNQPPPHLQATARRWVCTSMPPGW
jgi:hypothetical protein